MKRVSPGGPDSELETAFPYQSPAGPVRLWYWKDLLGCQSLAGRLAPPGV